MQKGKLYEFNNKFYVKFRATEMVNGVPQKKQRTVFLVDKDKDSKFYSIKAKALKDQCKTFMDGINEQEMEIARKLREKPDEAPAAVPRVEPLVPVTKLYQTRASAKDPKVVDFWTETYLPHLLGNGGKKGTQYQYQNLWKKHLEDHVGDSTLRSYGTAQASALLTELVKKGYGRWHIANVRKVGSAIFRHAMSIDAAGKGMLPVNPWANAKSLHKLPAKKETQHYTIEEARAILHALGHCTVAHKQKKMKSSTAKCGYCTIDTPEPHAAQEHTHTDAVMLLGLCFFLALRPHEAVALDWTDYKNGQMHISKGYYKGELSTNKTDDDVWLPVIEPLRILLDLWHKECGSPKSGFILKNKRNASPLNINNLYRRFIRPCLEEAGLEWNGMYAGRRGGATAVVELTGGNKEIAKMLLRHKGPDTDTLDEFYNKFKPKMLAAGMKAFEAAMAALEAEEAETGEAASV